MWQRLLKQTSNGIVILSQGGQFRQRHSNRVALLTGLVAGQAEVATARRRLMAELALKLFHHPGRCRNAQRVTVDCVIEPKPAGIPSAQSPKRRVVAREAGDIGQLRRK